MNETILNSVQFLYVIYNFRPFLRYKVLTKSISAAALILLTPMPTKPPGQNDASETFPLSTAAIAGVSLMMFCAISNAACCEIPWGGRKDVLGTLRSSPHGEHAGGQPRPEAPRSS